MRCTMHSSAKMNVAFIALIKWLALTATDHITSAASICFNHFVILATFVTLALSALTAFDKLVAARDLITRAASFHYLAFRAELLVTVITAQNLTAAIILTATQ